LSAALVAGLRAAARNWGLAVAVLALNLALAALLAAPLAATLEGEWAHTDSAHRMLYGFDFSWWSDWDDSRTGWMRSFGPDLFGVGLVFKNLDLLLKGELPLRLFARPGEEDADPLVDPVILAVGALYLLANLFLTGGLLAVLRAPQGGWTVRGLLHGAGFYFGRFFRIALVALALAWLVFAINAPLAAWVDGRAREAVSERAAMAWLLGRHALLLASLVAVSVLSGYAKVITVVEERSSALLAWLSAASFCLRNALRVAGHVLAVALLAGGLIVIWRLLDGAWTTTGYKTQLVTFALFEGFLLGRIFLRLSLLGGQVALYRRLEA
jgi:hypothetical protein